jgi:mono/diheme cytochrome c family protein
VDQPDVFVIQNNNAASLIPQGDTIARVGNGGYQAAAVPFFDPTSYFAQEQELIRAAEQTQLLRIQGTQALLQKALEIQAPALEVAARGQAASAILSAAGLSQGSNAGSVQGVVITRDAAGQVQVLQLEPAQVQNYLHQASQAAAPKPQPAAQPVVADGLVKTFCYACHGTNVAAPSGGLYLGTTPEILQVMRQEKASIIKRVENGTMPPAGSPQPTPQERQGLIQELQSMLGES